LFELWSKNIDLMKNTFKNQKTDLKINTNLILIFNILAQKFHFKYKTYKILGNYPVRAYNIVKPRSYNPVNGISYFHLRGG